MAHLRRADLRSYIQLPLSTSWHSQHQISMKNQLTRRCYGDNALLVDALNPNQSSNESLCTSKLGDRLEQDVFDNGNKKAHSGNNHNPVQGVNSDSSKKAMDGLNELILSRLRAGSAGVRDNNNERNNQDKIAHSGPTPNPVQGAKGESSKLSTGAMSDLILSRLRGGGLNPKKQDDGLNKTEFLAQKSDGGATKGSENKRWDGVLKSLQEMRSRSATSDKICMGDQAGRKDKGELKDDFLDTSLPEEIDKDNMRPFGIQSGGPSKRQCNFDFVKPPNQTNPSTFRAKGGGYSLSWSNNQRPMDKLNMNSRNPPHNMTMAPRAEILDQAKNIKTNEAPSKAFDEAASSSVNDVAHPKDYTVCIHNVPAGYNLAIMKDALSRFGIVTGSFKRPGVNGTCACYAEFENEDAMEAAIAARWLMIDGRCFPIIRTHQPITTVIRLSRVSPDTTEGQIMFTCGRYGSVDTIKNRGNGVFDVFYKVNELPHLFKILDSLNEVQMSHSRWIAVPAPIIHPGARKEVLKNRDGQMWHLSQLNRTLQKIEVALETATIALEDLKALNSLEDEIQGPPKS